MATNEPPYIEYEDGLFEKLLSGLPDLPPNSNAGVSKFIRRIAKVDTNKRPSADIILNEDDFVNIKSIAAHDEIQRVLSYAHSLEFNDL